MAGVQVLFDPTAEATGTQLDVTDSTLGYWLLEHAYPVPEDAVQRAGSADTEGDVPASSRPQNRTITLKIRCAEPSGGTPAIRTIVQDLQEKVGKLKREGGTYRLVLPDTTSITFDVLKNGAHNIDVPVGLRWLRRRVAEVTITLECKPYGRGAEQDLGDNIETTLPVLIFSEGSIPGDVDGLGRLVIDDDSGVNQIWVIFGEEDDSAYTHTTSSGSGALFYEAESRTPLSGAATAVGPSGASGGGSNVVRHTSLGTGYQAVLSTQASGGGAHLTHVGNFRVFARFQVPVTNAGLVSVALEWAEGDFRRRTINDATEFTAEQLAVWNFVDLGYVRLTKPGTGAQRWEGRILAKSTVTGDDVDVDYLLLVPVDVASGRVRGIVGFDNPTAFSARDGFDQTAGALTGKTAATGGVWVGGGDADDFTVETTGHTAQRTATLDVAVPTTPRLVTLLSAQTTMAVQVDMKWSVNVSGLEGGVVMRYVDASNYAAFGIQQLSGFARPIAKKVIAGSGALLTSVLNVDSAALATVATFRTVRLAIFSTGVWVVWLDGVQQAIGYDAIFATGGALDDGGVGIYDLNTSGSASTRNYDNFMAFTPTADAAMFASQSLEIRHDRVHREDSAGAIWTRVSDFEGDYLRVPPSAAEGRSVRTVVKGLRLDPEWGPDISIDDISARLLVTPRYFVVPT